MLRLQGPLLLPQGDRLPVGKVDRVDKVLQELRVRHPEAEQGVRQEEGREEELLQRRARRGSEVQGADRGVQHEVVPK